MSTMRRACWAGSVVAIVAAGAAPAGAAGNIVNNGHFHNNVSGWSKETPATPASFTFSAIDAADSAGSGSVRVRNTSAGPFNGAGIRQCSGAVVPGQPYHFGGKARLPTDQNRTGLAFVGLNFFTGPSCTGSRLNEVQRLAANETDSFVSLYQSETVPAGAASVEFVAFPSKSEAGGELVAFFDDLFFEVDAPCPGPPAALCLRGDRFRVEARWTRPAGGGSGPGTAVDLTDDTGLLWFFKSSNIELVVKVLDACSSDTPRFWFFAGGLTNVRVELTVTDTLTGEPRAYVNPQSTPYQPVQDVNAFASCE